MRYNIVSKPNGNLRDEVVTRIAERHFVGTLAIRVLEKNGEPIEEKLEIGFMMDLWLALGMRITSWHIETLCQGKTKNSFT
jgi:hypothetical protein